MWYAYYFLFHVDFNLALSAPLFFFFMIGTMHIYWAM